MTAKIIQMAQEELWATCPRCDSQEWHLIVTAELRVIGLECADDECDYGMMFDDG